MDYNSIGINTYIKSHLELQREITLRELALSFTFLFKSICLVYMNMFAKFDEIPAMTLQDFEGNKTLWMDNVKTVYPPQTVCGGIKTAISFA